MCGIVGVALNRDAERTLSVDLLKTLSDTMRHRGPDADGQWLNKSQKVGFGHRRLKIVDLEDLANQPMVWQSPDGKSVALCYNGEIYNFRELRQQLERSGRTFVTDHSDTEVLLQGYLCWGLDELLKKIRGIFAFAIYDERYEKLFLARDFAGIKPLYLTRQGNQLIFASEMRAILAMPDVEKKLNRLALRHYLSFLSVSAPFTLMKGVYKLPPGHLLECDLNTFSMQTRRYWVATNHDTGNLFEQGLTVTDPEVATLKVRDLLFEIVEQQLDADVPVGLFLSGGIDSSAILALTQKITGKRMESFSVRYDEDDYLDESVFAQEFAAQMGASHTNITLSEEDVFADWHAIVDAQEDPLADWVCMPIYALAREAHRNGLRTVMVGEGADEPFFGYMHYYSSLKRHDKWWGAGQSLIGDCSVSNGLASLIERIPSKRPGVLSRFDYLSRFLRGDPQFLSGAIGFYDLNAQCICPSLPQENEIAEIEGDLSALGMDASCEVLSSARAAASQSLLKLKTDYEPADICLQMMMRELDHRLPELLLMRVDKMTMAHSIEARVPFLDHRLLEYMAGLSRSVRLSGANGGAYTKPILKNALKGILPDEILNRPKTGFGTPMSKWLKGAVARPEIEKLLNSPLLQDGSLNESRVKALIQRHLNGQTECSQMIWALINLDAWHRNHRL